MKNENKAKYCNATDAAIQAGVFAKAKMKREHEEMIKRIALLEKMKK